MNDTKQVKLTAEMADVLERIINNDGVTPNSLGLCKQLRECGYLRDTEYFVKRKGIYWKLTHKGRAALEAHKAKQYEHLCEYCGGTGEVNVIRASDSNTDTIGCSACSGTGEIEHNQLEHSPCAYQINEPEAEKAEQEDTDWGGSVDNWRPKVDLELARWMFRCGFQFATEPEYADTEYAEHESQSIAAYKDHKQAEGSDNE